MTPQSSPNLPDARPAQGPVGGEPLIFKIGFKLPADAQAQPIQDWIGLLDVQLDPPLIRSADPHHTSTQATLWLQQILTLTLGLMHVLRVPIFQALEVLECQPTAQDPQTWQASIRRPDPQLIPPAVFEGVFKTAYALANWSCSAQINQLKDRKQFFKTIENNLLGFFQIIHPRGKSTFEVLRVAHRMGIAYTPLSAGAFQLGHGCHSRYLERSTTDGDSAMGVRLTQHKGWAAEMLNAAGLPGPTHTPVQSLEHAQQAAQRLGYPVVIKPADLERGEGVQVDVTPQQLDAAFAEALKRSPTKTVLVERQVAGVCHRLFIVRGQLLYAVKRMPMGVYGDGARTIRDVVTAEWQVQQHTPPWKRTGLRPLDDLAHQALERQGLHPEAIPSAGEFVALRRIESTAWGGVDEEVTHHIHPDNLAAACAAAELFQLEVAGVDIISPDIRQPWHTNGAIINEVNYAPLLGGGDISRRYVSEYLSRIMPHHGHIPIHVFAGHNALAVAQHAWSQGVEHSMQAVLVATDQVLMPNQQPWRMPLTGFYARSRATLRSRGVKALIMVVDTDEFLRTGLPCPRISSLQFTSNRFVSSIDGASLDDSRNQRMLNLMRTWPQAEIKD